MTEPGTGSCSAGTATLVGRFARVQSGSLDKMRSLGGLSAPVERRLQPSVWRVARSLLGALSAAVTPTILAEPLRVPGADMVMADPSKAGALGRSTASGRAVARAPSRGQATRAHPVARRG